MKFPPDEWPRVTEIISDIVPDAGMERFKATEPEALNAYATNGKEYHIWADKIAHGRFSQISPETMAMAFVDPGMLDAVLSLKLWFDENVEKIYHTEKIVFSKSYHYRGTLDLICKLKGTAEVVLIDHKRRAKVGRQGNLQTAAYVHAAQEMGLLPKGTSIRRAILRNPRGVNKVSLDWIDKKGKSTLDADIQAFLCCVHLAGWKKANP